MLVEGQVRKSTGSDFMLDSAPRRRPRRPVRALVHDRNDGLTVNFNGDYRAAV